MLGSQATLPPTKASDLAAALGSIGVPCFLGGMSRGLLGRDSPVQVRHRRREALREADFVLLLGTVCDFRLDYGRSFNRRAAIVAVNRSREQLLKNAGFFWSAKLAVEADVGDFVVRLGAALRAAGYACPAEWLQALQARDAAKEAENRARAGTAADGGSVCPIELLARLEDRALAPDSILVADGGDFVGTAAYILRPRRPLSWLDPGAFGTLGVGGGFALGAKLVRPDADVWIVYGDGSLAYSVAEFDTFVRHRTPVIALVGNDACWSQIAREQVPLFQSDVACKLAPTDYHVVAAGYGGRGLKLTDNGAIDETLASAVAISRAGQPVLVNALIARSNFREGSISV